MASKAKKDAAAAATAGGSAAGGSATGSAAVRLTKDEEREFREVFNLVDRDRSGTISREELAQLMRTLSINASQQELDLMISEIDTNNDGQIQFEEFVAVMSRKVQASYTAEDVRNAFKVFEGNSPPGYISLEALERALLLYGADRLTKEQVKELVSQLETENGLFNYADYVALMMTN